MFDGSYPPGVDDRMLDDYFGEGEYTACENCQHYIEGCCGVLETAYENEHGTEKLKALSEDDYLTLFGKEPDDGCEDWEEI